MSNKGGQGARKKAKARRDTAKRARKTANYIKTGPKVDSQKKKKKKFVIGKAKWDKVKYPRSMPKGQGTDHHKIQGKKRRHPKRPLRPLRQRQG